MPTTITQTRTASSVGRYVPTAVDARKAAADFRMVAIVGSKTAIVWKDGRSETVTDRALAKLQAQFTSATDF